MRVKIKKELKHSLSPPKHRIVNQIGEIVQVVGDGYCLIEFYQFMDGKYCLQWYVNDTDFYILNKNI